MKIDFVRKICVCVIPLLLALTGCCRILHLKESSPYRVVTQASILYENETLQTRRDFYREENIRHILDYLRYIDPYGIPKEDPMLVTGRNFCITVTYSDGSQHVYEQRADQYLRVDGGDWKRIDPHKAQYLSGLYGMMPSDAPPTDTPPAPLIRPYI